MLVITNAACAAGGKFSFDVTCASGLSLLVERKTALNATWQPFLYTNTITSHFRVNEPTPPSGSSAFYRLRIYP